MWQGYLERRYLVGNPAAGAGPAGANLALSEQRAAAVWRALVEIRSGEMAFLPRAGRARSPGALMPATPEARPADGLAELVQPN